MGDERGAHNMMRTGAEAGALPAAALDVAQRLVQLLLARLHFGCSRIISNVNFWHMSSRCIMAEGTMASEFLCSTTDVRHKMNLVQHAGGCLESYANVWGRTPAGLAQWRRPAGRRH